MGIDVRDLKWSFNRGQAPVFLWRAEDEHAPSFLSMKGAWRSGKSTVAFRRFTLNHLRTPGLRSLVVRLTYPELIDSCFDYIWKSSENLDNWHRLGFIEKVKVDEMTIFTKNGGRVDFRPALHNRKEDPARFGSISYGQIWIEEASEVSHKTFLTLHGRLSQRGTPLEMLLSFNPPVRQHWLHDEFVLRRSGQKALFTLTMEDNREHLPEGYIESFDGYPPSWRKRYIEGDWGIITEGDPVHPRYTEDAHVSASPLEWDKREPIIRCWDGSPTAIYYACAWMQLQRDGRLFIFGGRLWRNEGVKYIKKQALKLSSVYYPGAKFVDFGDPQLLVESKIELRSAADMFRPEIDIQPGAVTFTERREAMDEWLGATIVKDGRMVAALQIDPGPEAEMIRDGLAGGYCLVKLSEEYQKRPKPDKSEFSHQIEAVHYGLTGLDAVRWEMQRRKSDYEARPLPAIVGGWMGV